jgi:aerobic carbon-monoxide dehydrogenase large subunit
VTATEERTAVNGERRVRKEDPALLSGGARFVDFKTDHTVTPGPTNPLGVKGLGETGTIASTPAVINAVVDALSPWGVTDNSMPATSERVWNAVRGGRP